ncbi:MAG: GntR family transcriptional regulator [Betaproteobacteria bacterium]|nr:GntR family transcriptional regulator [Betaproteobacteria bacterium]
MQFHHGIARLIELGRLRLGSQLPPEQVLAAAVRLSLGTVQKALANLASEGWISREHGRGTFVQGPRKPLADLWHFRFHRQPGGEPLPVYSTLLSRRALRLEAGPVVEALGADAAGYIELTRLISGDDRAYCWSQIFLRASKFRRLLDMPQSALESINLKEVFAREFACPTLSVVQYGRITTLSPEACRALKRRRAVTGFRLRIVASSHGNTPFSLQYIEFPENSVEIDLSTGSAAPGSITSRQ